MDGPRIVKVQLPSRLVEAMDQAIESAPGYRDRSAFVADAVENLLADLTVEPAGVGDVVGAPPVEARFESESMPLRASMRSPSGAPAADQPAELALFAPVRRSLAFDDSSGRPAMRVREEYVVEAPPERWRPADFFGTPEDAEAALVLTAPTDVPPLAPEPGPVAEEPTWGMHNRDWPTLWVASHLARTSLEGGPQPFAEWRDRLGGDAADLAYAVAASGSLADVSGLPNVRKGGDKSILRFLSLFVGDTVGIGPLFSLGLAAAFDPEPDEVVELQRLSRRNRESRDLRRIALTEPGLDLLRRLDGFTPWPAPVSDEHRRVWLGHLARWVPADLELLTRVLTAIADGHDTRVLLVELIREQYGWPSAEGRGGSRAPTNVAGILGRAREWNLVERRQHKDQYVLVDDALDALAAVRG